MQEFAGKVAVVTGAASGIGLALAERFGTQGMRVVIADVEREALERAEAGLRARGVEVLAVQTDVSERSSVEALADRTRATFGPWHVVCNNAGVQQHGIMSWEAPAELWDWILGVNLMGVVNGVGVFLPDMIQRDEGHMINTASAVGMGRFWGVGVGPYIVSKCAILGLTETLYHELGTSRSAVKVSALCPGQVRTEIRRAHRNWPDRLGTQPRLPGKEDDEMNPHLEQADADNGMDPTEVAQLVLDAVHDERFWIFTNPQYNEAWLARCAAVADGRNPELHAQDI